MKDFPRTLTGLLLRISQCIFAAAFIASMATTSNFFNFTTFWILNGEDVDVEETVRQAPISKS